jgi:hypothetical protein
LRHVQNRRNSGNSELYWCIAPLPLCPLRCHLRGGVVGLLSAGKDADGPAVFDCAEGHCEAKRILSLPRKIPVLISKRTFRPAFFLSKGSVIASKVVRFWKRLWLERWCPKTTHTKGAESENLVSVNNADMRNVCHF